MPSSYSELCIRSAPSNSLRCWWVYIPSKVTSGSANVKVPLVIDMHGGDGCASHQASTSGFKELSDTLAASAGDETFITVWPQGYNLQWGTCGSACDKAQQDNPGKDIQTTDDLSFLSSLLAFMIKSQSPMNIARNHIDVTRIYTTGFSMGCMMSHRLALERSDIIAGFGCHGGTLIAVDGNNIDEERKRFQLQSMPAYMTGGTDDPWFHENTFDIWGNLNSCGTELNVTNITLASQSGKNGKKDSTEAVTIGRLKVRPSCLDNTETVRLELIGGEHTPDSRMAALTYNFLKKYRRSGAEVALSSIPSPELVKNGAAMMMISNAISYCLMIIVTISLSSGIIF
eukprot:g1539.t1